jgi:prevent-host-death family protein
VKERAISVTEASRNFAECINRVRYQGISYLLLKNGAPVARLIPEGAASLDPPPNSGDARSEEMPVAKPAQDTAAAGPHHDVSGDRRQQTLRRVLQW